MIMKRIKNTQTIGSLGLWREELSCHFGKSRPVRVPESQRMGRRPVGSRRPAVQLNTAPEADPLQIWNRNRK